MDDNEFNLFVLSSYLRNLGMVADEAVNGKEAIAKMAAKAENCCCNKYEVVVMDINMPVMNGMQASSVIKRKMLAGELPETLIVALTAELLKEKELEKLYEESGFSDCIFKPTTKENFMKLLRKHNIIA